MKKWFSISPGEQQIGLALLLLRILSGAFILTHGFPKLMRLFSGNEIKFMNFLGLGPEVSLSLAVFAEFFCAILIILGAATRLATIPLMITMGTAAFVAHADDPFGTKEKPLLYLVVFAFLLISGAGKYSVDSRLAK